MNTNIDYYRIFLASVFAPLMLVPTLLIVSVTTNVYLLFAGDDYYKFTRIIHLGEFGLSFYVAGVAMLVTFVYGVPVYISLNHYKFANIFTLPAAGFAFLYFLFGGLYFSLLGAFVAFLFWLIVTPFNTPTRKLINKASMIIAGVSVLMLILVKTLSLGLATAKNV